MASMAERGKLRVGPCRVFAPDGSLRAAQAAPIREVSLLPSFRRTRRAHVLQRLAQRRRRPAASSISSTMPRWCSPFQRPDVVRAGGPRARTPALRSAAVTTRCARRGLHHACGAQSRRPKARPSRRAAPAGARGLCHGGATRHGPFKSVSAFARRRGFSGKTAWFPASRADRTMRPAAHRPLAGQRRAGTRRPARPPASRLSARPHEIWWKTPHRQGCVRIFSGFVRVSFVGCAPPGRALSRTAGHEVRPTPDENLHPPHHNGVSLLGFSCVSWVVFMQFDLDHARKPECRRFADFTLGRARRWADRRVSGAPARPAVAPAAAAIATGAEPSAPSSRSRDRRRVFLPGLDLTLTGRMISSCPHRRLTLREIRP